MSRRLAGVAVAWMAAAAATGAVAPAAAAPAGWTSTAAAPAGWTSPVAVQPGTDPVLAFSPRGAIALGSASAGHRSAEVTLASPEGSFATTSPLTLPVPRGDALASLALGSGGTLAAILADPSAPAPIEAAVSAGPGHRFGTAQQIIPAGGASREQAVQPQLSIVPVAGGALVSAGTDDAGDLLTAALTPPGTRFSLGSGPKGMSASDAFALVTDPSGDAYLAGDGADGCTTVAYRAPRGHLSTTYRTGNCSSGTPNIFDAVTATAHGAALLTEDVSESGTGVTRLFVQVGQRGRFGPAQQLGGPLGGPVGLAVDADGTITAEWSGCSADRLENGELTTTDCAIDAASGTIGAGFSAAAAAGTVLERSRPDTTLSALTADRGIVVSRCAKGKCSLNAFTSTQTGAFRRGHLLGEASQLIALDSDSGGDLLAVWIDPHGTLYAATGSAATGSWSAPHRLAARISAHEVSAAYGPRGVAMVAWSAGNETDVETYAR